MPRNGSGTYSLPSGNPVQSGTLIDATWANNTLNDIANELTDSLSRSGEGGMLAPFRLSDGVQATPGLAWTNEPSTGFYRAGTNEMWSVVGGTQVTQFTANGMAGRFAAGAVTTPSVTRLGDLNTGIYFPGADEFAIATGGVARMTFDSAGAVAIPGTLSVTGDVTVDTNTLFVDAANNRVGVGTVTPAVKLDVAGGVSIGSADNLTWGGAYGATTPAISGSAGFLAFYPNGSTSGELMRLTATGLGIGTTSPAVKLAVVSTGGETFSISGGGTSTQYQRFNTTGGNYYIGVSSSTGTGLLGGASNYSMCLVTESARDMIFGTNNTERLRIDASGNAGLGVTPSAWSGTAKALQVANVGVEGRTDNASYATLSANGYTDSGTWKYISSDFASRYTQFQGQHLWLTAPSGTAGNAITFTQAMTLDASGRLGIGETAPATTFNVGSKDHGVGIAYINSSTLPSLAGSYTTSSGWGQGFGDLILKSRTDFGGFYNIIFATASSNNTPVERARFTAAGALCVNSTSAVGTNSKFTVQNGTNGDTIAFFGNNDPQGLYISNDATTPRFVRLSASGAFGGGFIFTLGNTDVATFNLNNEFIVGGTTDNGAYNLQCNGTGVWGAGAYVNGSDERLKDNIQSLDSGLDVVKAMRAVTFQYKPQHSKDQSVQPGFIAQELQQAMAGKAYLDGVVQSGPEYLNVAYQNIIPILVKAIQELEAKVAALEAGV